MNGQIVAADKWPDVLRIGQMDLHHQNKSDKKATYQSSHGSSSIHYTFRVIKRKHFSEIWQYSHTLCITTTGQRDYTITAQLTLCQCSKNVSCITGHSATNKNHNTLITLGLHVKSNISMQLLPYSFEKQKRHLKKISCNWCSLVKMELLS